MFFQKKQHVKVPKDIQKIPIIVLADNSIELEAQRITWTVTASFAMSPLFIFSMAPAVKSILLHHPLA